MDVMVVTLQELGNSSKIRVLLQEVFLEIPNGAELTHLLHVITTLLVNINHVVPHNQLHHVLKHATLNLEKNITQIKSELLILTQFQTMKLKFKMKSLPTDQSKLPSLFMKILFHTNQVFTNTLLVHNSEVMPLKLLDGVLKTVLNIGLLLTHGITIGVSMVPSKS